VVGPTGTASLGGPDDTEGARQRLGACLVLSGGVRVSEESSLVVFTQLVRTADRVHVWASTDTVGPMGGLDAVTAEVLGGIDGALAGCGG